MLIRDSFHLTYCTNIHPGESWEEVRKSLETYTLPLKRDVSPDAPMGVGLRLSDQASRELGESELLKEFREWLDNENLYVFTMNGFPFGGFHRQRVKDDVHTPDWTTEERLEYTLRLFRQLAILLPEGQQGGISTSPLSYKYWHKSEAELNQVYQKACRHFGEVAAQLHLLKEEKGIEMHLDIEPEPDGLLERTDDVLHFYKEKLIPIAGDFLQEKYAWDTGKAESVIRRHIQLCYDVCHYAVVYEDHAEALEKFEQAGIRIGKFQLSAALKADIPSDSVSFEKTRTAFSRFNESTYLHQVVARYKNGSYYQFPDLAQALTELNQESMAEWRTHFHVPIFLPEYSPLKSTQQDIVDVLNLLKEKIYSTHLEVETYTWEVLPEDIQQDLGTSIQRELNWVLAQMK